MRTALAVAFFLLLISCVLSQTTDTRETYAFGNNERGQLGIVNARAINALKATTNKAAKFFCSTDDSAILVLSDNSLWTWGIDNGQIGMNRSSHVNDYVDVPTQVTLPVNTTFSSIGCSFDHALLLETTTFKVFGFGHNNKGQLGTGNTNVTSYVAPFEITNLQQYNFKKIFVYGSTSYGIRQDNSLWSWGLNDMGQMGVDLGSAQFSAVPLKVLDNVADVKGGNDFALYLTIAGNVYVSGSNVQGQTGLNTTSVLFQFNATAIPFFNSMTVSRIAAGGYAALVATNTGAVYGFGRNDYGQLSLPLSNKISAPTQINTTAIPDPTKITAIALGSEHSIFVTSDNNVYTTGRNNYGQLGLAETQPIDSIIGLQRAIIFTSQQTENVTGVYVAKGASFFTVPSGTLYSFGYILKAGHGTYVHRPAVTASTTQFETVYAGLQISFAIQKSTGTVWAWGRNDYGAVYSGNTIDRFVPLLFTPLASQNMTYIALATGEKGSGNVLWGVFALRNDTKVFGFGRNDDGQMALGTLVPPLVTTPIVLDVTNDTIVKNIDVGARHILLRGQKPSSVGTDPNTGKDTGIFDLFAWGGNTEGQVGLGGLPSRQRRTIIKENIVAFAAGDFSTLYVDSNNVMSVSGENFKGQIGMKAVGQISTFSESAAFTLVLNATTGLKRNFTISTVYSGSESTFVITNVGVYVMGDNTYGTLGLNSSYTLVKDPVLNPLFPPVKQILKISSAKAGGKHTLVLTTDGKVYAMGRNNFGQLGLGDHIDRYAPVQLTFPNGAVALDVAAGSDHSLVVTGSKKCPNDCNGVERGTCNYVTGACVCGSDEASGITFTGFDCSLFICPDTTCSGHGRCDYTTGECVCEALFNGEKCQYRKCPNNCSGNGSCDRTKGICTCNSSMKGIDCSRPASDESSQFSGKLVATITVIILVASFFIL